DAPAARPFAPSATYVGIEVQASLLTRGAVPAVAADAAHLPLRDRSVDHLVARNVFGDVGLGHDFEAVVGFDPPGYAAPGRGLVARGALAELYALRARVRAMTAAVTATKAAILADAGRVLRGHGTLLLVETLTPEFAVQWIEQVAGGRVKDEAVVRAGPAAF